MYIAFEGIVGTGKTTQAKRLYAYLEEKYPEREVIFVREPGSTVVAERIRELVQGKKYEEDVAPMTEIYLFAAARAQLIQEKIKPTLDAGGIVVADRSFVTSLGYQGGGRGYGVDIVYQANKIAVGEYIPDYILYFTGEMDVFLERTFDEDGDKYESLGKNFFKAIEQGYIEASKMPLLKERRVQIDAMGTKAEVTELVHKTVDGLFA